MKKTLIELKNASKYFKQGNRIIKAVDNVSLKVDQGEFVVIVGASGSGKSTLMQLMGGLDTASSGEVTVEGKNIQKMKEIELAKLRQNTFGFIFQNFNLIPTLTAQENVEAPVIDKDGSKKAYEMLVKVGLADRADHLPNLLSGGGQQRVAIARALINNPDIIFADEPTGNLDSKTGEEIIAILKDLNKKEGKTVVMITHDLDAKKIADKLISIKDGKIS